MYLGRHEREILRLISIEGILNIDLIRQLTENSPPQDNVERNRLSVYWKQFGGVFVGCTSLLVFDLCER